MKNTLIALAVLTVLFMVMGFAGTMDYEAEAAEEKMYCEMVEAGNWPDYNNNFNDICK